ncbi:MAG: DUF4416 family protein [Candidatus Coatesbacteria bacterium]|nr:MAG: DUF4416 family protein [Candidatus Coatesbacteria bacterium]
MSRVPEVLPLLGVIASPAAPLAELESEVHAELFETGLATPTLPFDFTDYYEAEMGAGLVRRWHAATSLLPADRLPALKEASIQLESRWSEAGLRRVNVDPGYISETQLLLATTKPLPAAVYLRDGLFAVVELLYYGAAFRELPWTYPDYAAAAARGWFEPFRILFLKLRKEAAP